MSPTMWPRTDTGIAVRRFGHFDRLGIRRRSQRDHADAAREQAKLLGRAAGEVDHADPLGGHPVGDGDVDGLTGLLHRHADPGAQRQRIVRGGHGMLVEANAAAGAPTIEAGTIPGRLAALLPMGGQCCRIGVRQPKHQQGCHRSGEQTGDD